MYNVTSLRFRQAWKFHGHDVRELPFKAAFGVWGSWAGLILIGLVLIAQFYVALWPVGGPSPDPSTRVATFFRKSFAAAGIFHTHRAMVVS